MTSGKYEGPSDQDPEKLELAIEIIEALYPCYQVYTAHNLEDLEVEKLFNSYQEQFGVDLRD